MSVIIESQEGDKIVVISNFIVCEDGIDFAWEHSKEFKIGDFVYFKDYFKDKNQQQEYIAWKIKFRDNEGKEYSAIQNYFTTTENWEEIKSYFVNNNIKKNN